MTEGFRVSQIVLHYIQPICLLDTSLGNFTPVATLVGHTRGPVDTLPLCSLVSFAGFISSVHPLSFFPSSLYGSLGDLTLSKVSCLIDAFKNCTFKCKLMDSFFPFVFCCMHTREVQDAHKSKFWCIWRKAKEYSNLHEDGMVYKLQEKSMTRTSLVVQWLRICPAIFWTILFMRMQCTASLYIGLSALGGGCYPNPR